MKFANKEFAFYWKVIRWPVLILAAWNIIGFIVSLTAFDSYMDIFGSALVGWGVPIIVYLVAGYLARSELKATGGESAWAGGLTGFLVGLVGLVLMVIMVSNASYMQNMAELSMQKAMEAAAGSGAELPSMEMMTSIMRISMVVGGIIGPFISGLIGALFAWLGGLIDKKMDE